MKRHRLVIATAVLVALGGLAIWLSVSRAPVETPPEDLTTALPDLDKDEIDEIEVRRPAADQPTVRLARRPEGWRLVEPVDAEADASAVETALDRLDEMKAGRLVASNAAHHARLEVDAEHAVRVIVRGDGQTLADLWIGGYGAGFTNVRREGQDRVWGVEGSIKWAFNRDVKDWRNRRITDVSTDEVREIAFQTSAGSWRFVRNSENEWALPAGVAAIERFSPSKVDSIVSTLARLSAVDFAATDATRESTGIGEQSARVTLTVVRRAPDAGVGDAGGPDASVPTLPPESITLRLGNGRDENREYYLARDGVDIVYVVSSYVAEKINVTLASFQSTDSGSASTSDSTAMTETAMTAMTAMGSAAAMTPTASEPPSSGPSAMTEGTRDIPPEVMREIQRQLQNR
ncbi:MAG: DUF4340 domain-containing protein [Myxococcota bacterium]|nr:DUF4340 domain-containing protein [Myxococcota bacterium]MDW8361758.1 DUF4340 domain-containing protein [Myxococcales bacterium]